MADISIHKGAGIIFLTPQGKALFLKRGPGGDAPGQWCFPGGTQEAGETSEQCAAREAKEELGSVPSLKLTYHSRVILPITTISPETAGQAALSKVDFTTYKQLVAEEFAPTLNGEHTGYAWAPINEPPEPLHPGCRIALDRFNWDELGVARAMSAGLLTSPQLYGNVHLFDMRITGTGTAYRGPKYDENDKEIAPEEFVYRRPENYLTDEFLARCNGLQVIMMHPAKALLNSKEFGARTVGSMMLPYIKGDEVWGIAKVYDEDAVKALTSSQMSTSPAVLLGNGDQKLTMEDGTDLLIEGKPSLLDHLAICERGVWDKGGDPSGVRTDNQTGDTDMTKEQLEALNKQVADAVAAALPGLVTAGLAARADDAGGQKLDKVLSAMDAFIGKMDALNARVDAFEDKFGKGDADEDKKEDEDEDGKNKKDEDENVIAADKAKKDSEAKAAKEKADAEAAEKAKADAEAKAKADAAAQVKADSELRDRLAAVEKNVPKQQSDADYHACLAAQAKADDIYGGFGQRAPRPLSGEDVLPYRKRLAAGLKHHSAAWKEVDVLAIADSQTFSIAEGMIFKDAALAALNPTDLKDDEMREIVKQDSTTGVRTIEFRGRHSFVKSLTRPANHVRAIGIRKEA